MESTSCSKQSFSPMREISRRGFLKGTIAGLLLPMFHPLHHAARAAADPGSPIFWVKNVPNQPFYGHGNGNYHAGIDTLLRLLGDQGLKFYRSSHQSALSGASGMIEPNDIVLIKVNAQWKYRGSTNTDLIRGLIQRILDHPDGFTGEVVIFENGQSQGSLNGNARGWGSYPDSSVHANANNESQSFNYLVNTTFHNPRVSSFLLDPIGGTFIGSSDHVTNGYRTYENVSYPCFTTAGGHRVELREGIWQGSGYSQNLKLINVPVLKHHDTGGSEITASLKHFYGVVSMSDGQSNFRHYGGLGETCGKMMVSVRTPILNIIDAIWVSYSSLSGYPATTTYRSNQILASQDPVALDYWAAKYVLYPIDNNSRHHPSFSGIDVWLTGARDMINGRGGLYKSDSGILVGNVTKNEGEMVAHSVSATPNPDSIGIFRNGLWALDINGNDTWDGTPTDRVFLFGINGDFPVVGDWNGDGTTKIGIFRNGLWALDLNGNGQWDGEPTDRIVLFGTAGDIPVTGDWNGNGRIKIGIFRNGLWALDLNGNGAWDGTPTDQLTIFGIPGDIPVAGDWNGDGRTKIGIFRDGLWALDFDGDGVFNPLVDKVYGFGTAGDIPVTGDWNGDGITEIGIFRNGTWVLDVNGTSGFEILGDSISGFGISGDSPVSGKW